MKVKGQRASCSAMGLEPDRLGQATALKITRMMSRKRDCILAWWHVFEMHVARLDSVEDIIPPSADWNARVRLRRASAFIETHVRRIRDAHNRLARGLVVLALEPPHDSERVRVVYHVSYSGTRMILLESCEEHIMYIKEYSTVKHYQLTS
eukprot:IDg19410t1